jgi:hypothetical protein
MTSSSVKEKQEELVSARIADWSPLLPLLEYVVTPLEITLSPEISPKLPWSKEQHRLCFLSLKPIPWPHRQYRDGWTSSILLLERHHLLM